MAFGVTVGVTQDSIGTVVVGGKVIEAGAGHDDAEEWAADTEGVDLGEDEGLRGTRVNEVSAFFEHPVSVSGVVTVVISLPTDEGIHGVATHHALHFTVYHFHGLICGAAIDLGCFEVGAEEGAQGVSEQEQVGIVGDLALETAADPSGYVGLVSPAIGDEAILIVIGV